MMQYKGYVGVAQIDEEAGIISGRVVGLKDVITFESETVPGTRRAFEESVDSYLAFCAKRGEAPERPFSGKFLVRIPSGLHRDLSVAAESRGLSLNALVGQLLERSMLRGPDGEGRPARIEAHHHQPGPASPLTTG